ncbi:MAG: PDZ domain-containing protein, partial [Acidobacteriota bacterium]
MQGMNKSGSWKVALVLVASGLLLVSGVRNMTAKASFRLLDDGVFWESREGRVVAKRIDPDGPAAGAGIRKGDVLAALGRAPVDSPEDVRRVLNRSAEGETLNYQIVREDVRQALAVRVAPLPRGNVGLYYFLAAVGIFSLVVGTVVYVRRRGVAATAHFYLLCVFWFLAYGISFTGKLDGWDFAFYWMDRAGVLFFPPIFLHFALCFPERKPLVNKSKGVLLLLYLPSMGLIYLSLLAKLLFFADVPWGDTFFLWANELLNRLTPAFVAFVSLA